MVLTGVFVLFFTIPVLVLAITQIEVDTACITDCRVSRCDPAVSSRTQISFTMPNNRCAPKSNRRSVRVCGIVTIAAWGLSYVRGHVVHTIGSGRLDFGVSSHSIVMRAPPPSKPRLPASGFEVEFQPRCGLPSFPSYWGGKDLKRQKWLELRLPEPMTAPTLGIYCPSTYKYA